MLTCTAHEVGGVLVVTFEESPPGTDDRASSHRQSLYGTVQSREDPRFAVDLGTLEYMSSADVGFLISLKRRVDARKGQLVLFAVHPYIKSTLGTMKLLSLFRLAEDLTEALGMLPTTVV